MTTPLNKLSSYIYAEILLSVGWNICDVYRKYYVPFNSTTHELKGSLLKNRFREHHDDGTSEDGKAGASYRLESDP